MTESTEPLLASASPGTMETEVVAPEAAAPGKLQPKFMRLVQSGWPADMISQLGQLGVWDVLGAGPRAPEDLARAVHGDVWMLSRVMDCLTDPGVLGDLSVVVRAGGHYRLTPLGHLLRTDARGSLADLAQMHGGEAMRRGWEKLAQGIRTGQSPFSIAHGMPTFEWYAEHPEEAEVFNRAMEQLAAPRSVAVAEAIGWSRHETVIDLGGGHGQVLAELLKRNPQVKGVLYDLPKVVEGAGEFLGRYEAEGRCRCEKGSFFESVPAVGDSDAYLLGNAAHNWSDEKVVSILRNCQREMGPRNRVYLAEHLMPEDGGSDPAGRLMDVVMLVTMEGGCQRKSGDFAALAERAGLHVVDVVPTKSFYSLVEMAVS